MIARRLSFKMKHGCLPITGLVAYSDRCERIVVKQKVILPNAAHIMLHLATAATLLILLARNTSSSTSRSPLSPCIRKRFSSVLTQRTLMPNSTAACRCVMCRFLTSCRTFSRSRSFADIHSPSSRSAMSHKSGTFYFAERGTSHFAATPATVMSRCLCN